MRWLLALMLVLASSGCQEVRALNAMTRSVASFQPWPDDARVRFQPGAEKNARIVAAALDQATARVERVQSAFAKPVVVYLPTDLSQYARYCASRQSSACVINQRLFISPKPVNTPERIPRLLTHELSHLQMEQHLGLWRWMLDAPVWFQEGLAVFVSGGAGAEKVTPRQATQALREGRGFTPNVRGRLLFRKSAHRFGLKPHMFYRQAGMFVVWLHDSDPVCFRAMLKRMQSDTPLEQAMRQSCGAGVEDKWREFIRQVRTGEHESSF